MIALLPALALASAAQPAAAEVEWTRLHCRVVAVNGSTVDFPFEISGSGDEQRARISGPAAAFVATGARGFRIPGLTNPLLFQVNSISGAAGHFSVALRLEHDSVAGFPVAHGSCSPTAIAAPTTAPTTLSALDAGMLQRAVAAHLPCFMLTLDGRVSRFETHLVESAGGMNRVFEPLDRTVWSGARTSPEMRVPDPPVDGSVPVRVYTIFNGGDGTPNPTGLSVGYIDPDMGTAVGLLDFVSLGTGAASNRRVAHGICAIELRREQE